MFSISASLSLTSCALVSSVIANLLRTWSTLYNRVLQVKRKFQRAVALTQGFRMCKGDRLAQRDCPGRSSGKAGMTHDRVPATQPLDQDKVTNSGSVS